MAIDARVQANPGQIPDAADPGRPHALFPSWPFVVLAAPIVLRAGLIIVALVTQPWTPDPNRIIPAWAQLLQAAFFAAIAAVLLHYGRADRRAWSLGLFVLDAASTLSEPFVKDIVQPTAVVRLALNLRTDAFQAALLWFFASEFPRPARARWLGRAFAIGTGLALFLGTLLASLDAYAVVNDGGPETTALALANSVRRQSPGPGDWYFSLQFLLLTPLLVMVPMKLREWGPDDRRRFVWLIAGLALGLAPLIGVSLATLSPATSGTVARHLRLFGLVIALSLTLVPAAAAYAALVQRTLDLRLVVRAALQYVFARSGVTILATMPLFWLSVVLFANRDQSVGALIAGPEGSVLAALVVLGGGAALARTRLLAALDRAFFREQIDARRTLLSFIESARNATSLSALSETVAGAVAQSFHPSHTHTLVAGDDAFQPQDSDVRPLLRVSALAQLVEGSDAPFSVDHSNGAVVERLSESERAWLAATQAELLVPMRGVSGELLGMLALGEKRSELPYTRDDRTLLTAVGSACGLALERIIEAERQGSTPRAGTRRDRPARECVECGTVLEPDALACVCGGLLQRAPVPHLLDDHLRFLQRIGAGGMGVVYRAIDTRLQQVRAVKTLIGPVEPATVARLRREARAMAAARHPNLATLYGLELWRGAPMLVMEFLEGGTLADRLRRGPLPSGQVLRLGATLAEAVGALHAAGLLHRDIKPSNIGFAADGTPKLLDFGLAKLLARPATTMSEDVGNDSTWSVSGSMTGEAGIRGTPAYLSPDVLSGAPASPADDLWSLSVTLLEACAGANPLKGPSVPATVTRVMTYETWFVQEAWPCGELFTGILGPADRRPRTAAQLLRALDRALQDPT